MKGEKGWHYADRLMENCAESARGGVRPEYEKRLENLEASRAGGEDYGLAKISRAADVTEDNGLVLGTREKNPSQEGTIMNAVEKAVSGLTAQIESVRNKNIKYCTAFMTAKGENLTVPENSNVLSVQNCGVGSSENTVTGFQRTSATNVYVGKNGSDRTQVMITYLT